MPAPKKPSSPKSPVRATRAKASKPEVKPLEPHLAALLSPALSPARGFEEAAQSAYDAGAVTGLDPEQLDAFGLNADGAPQNLPGVQATIDSLDQLLRLGDPNIRNKAAWTPHRPARPDKSEGGVRFELVSEYEPWATSRRRSRSWSAASKAQRARSGAARRHRLGQDLHHGEGDRTARSARR